MGGRCSSRTSIATNCLRGDKFLARVKIEVLYRLSLLYLSVCEILEASGVLRSGLAMFVEIRVNVHFSCSVLRAEAAIGYSVSGTYFLGAVLSDRSGSLSRFDFFFGVRTSLQIFVVVVVIICFVWRRRACFGSLTEMDFWKRSMKLQVRSVGTSNC